MWGDLDTASHTHRGAKKTRFWSATAHEGPHCRHDDAGEQTRSGQPPARSNSPKRAGSEIPGRWRTRGGSKKPRRSSGLPPANCRLRSLAVPLHPHLLHSTQEHFGSSATNRVADLGSGLNSPTTDGLSRKHGSAAASYPSDSDYWGDLPAAAVVARHRLYQNRLCKREERGELDLYQYQRLILANRGATYPN